MSADPRSSSQPGAPGRVSWLQWGNEAAVSKSAFPPDVAGGGGASPLPLRHPGTPVLQSSSSLTRCLLPPTGRPRAQGANFSGRSQAPHPSLGFHGALHSPRKFKRSVPGVWQPVTVWRNGCGSGIGESGFKSKPHDHGQDS